MEVKMIEKLKDKLCGELETVARKSQFSPSDLDTMQKMIVSIEKLMKIEEMEEGGEYSERYSRAGRRNYGSYNDSYGDSYGDDYSGRQHWVRGHYSRAEGASMVKDHIRKMMDENEISGNDRRTLERAMEILD